jgi:hypothetical protein
MPRRIATPAGLFFEKNGAEKLLVKEINANSGIFFI